MKPLEYGLYYHIYNRGNNREDLFLTPENYRHFLKLYTKYISVVADTFAWVLMKNHFHLLIRVKEEEEIGYYKLLKPDRSSDSVRFQTTTDNNGFNPKKPDPTRHFSHLFNAYAKYFNILFNRTGCLFQRPFKRLEITSEDYLKQVVVYIHTNPIHHGFTKNIDNYPWSSYQDILTSKPENNTVIHWFENLENFIQVHNEKIRLELIDELEME